jgi:competence protein ComEA
MLNFPFIFKLARILCGTGVFACLLLPQATAQALPDNPGKETFETTCSLCHSPLAVAGMHKTKAEWRSKVTEMLQEQSDVSTADRNTIIDYLAKSFPATVNINKAEAKDLEAILNLTPKEAQAIIEYRTAKGPYKTLDDLKKVPNIDATRLESTKQQLEFQ